MDTSTMPPLPFTSAYMMASVVTLCFVMSDTTIGMRNETNTARTFDVFTSLLIWIGVFYHPIAALINCQIS